MAGDWIKMRGNLWDDPRVSGLAEATKQKEATIIGGLYWLWATADQHTEDGFMPGLTLGAIDRKTGIKGFGAALAEIGWAEEGIGGIGIPRFDEHNGASAKERAQTARRVAAHKAKGNGKVTQEPLLNEGQSNGSTVTSALPREEKEKSKPISVDNVSGKQPVGTPAGEVCARLKLVGILDVNPMHPKLLALLNQGLTVEEIASIGPEAKQKGKGFAWILQAALGRRHDAANIGTVPAKAETPWYMTASGIERKAADVGVEQKDGEPFPIFKERVFLAAGVTSDMLHKANIDYGVRTS